MHLTYAGADQADRPWAVHVLQGPVEQSGLLHRPHLLRLGHSQGLQRRHRPPYYYGRTYYGCGHVTMAVLTMAVAMLLWPYLLVTMAVLSLAVVTVAVLTMAVL